MPVDKSWVSVAQYSDPISARIASGRLAAENIQSGVSRPAFSTGLYYLRVPPDFVDAAKRVLESSASLDEGELSKLALKEPPPDDYVRSQPTGTPSLQALAGSLGSRADSVDVEAKQSTRGSISGRLLVIRRVLMWAHIALGITVALVYISQLPGVIFTAKYYGILALIPYGVSYGHASRVMTESWFRAAAFGLALVGVSSLVVWLLLGAWGLCMV